MEAWRNCQPEPEGGTASTRPSGVMTTPAPVLSVNETAPVVSQIDRNVVGGFVAASS